MKTETENLRELDAEMHRICGWQQHPDGMWGRERFLTAEPAHYTKGEQFQELLEKCASETATTIRKQSDGSFCAWWTDSENMNENYIMGETLPLAICRFLKAFYSK